jgi:RNA polymerase sigma-70 factor (ECF subfamily)
VWVGVGAETNNKVINPYYWLMTVKELSLSATDELLAAAQQDDTEAFRNLVQHSEGKIAAFLRTLLGPIPLAEDLGQDVFLKAFASLKRFQREEEFQLFLLHTAVAIVMPVLKKQSRREFNQSVDPVSAIKNADQPMDRYEIFQFIFNHLEPELQVVIALRLIEGYSVTQMEKILDVSKEAIIERLALAQSRIRYALEETLR